MLVNLVERKRRYKKCIFRLVLVNPSARPHLLHISCRVVLGKQEEAVYFSFTKRWILLRRFDPTCRSFVKVMSMTMMFVYPDPREMLKLKLILTWGRFLSRNSTTKGVMKPNERASWHCSVTRLGDLFHYGQLFKAYGNN